MKKYILPTLLVLVLMLLSYAYLAPDCVERALIVGVDTKAVFHVVDDAGNPVEESYCGWSQQTQKSPAGCRLKCVFCF